MNALADSDTIAAIATGAGNAGVGIIRLSGPRAFAITHALTGAVPGDRVATFVAMRDRRREILDRGLLLHFGAPHSFTGEDVAELHCHGGSVLLHTRLAECLHRGARQADPGEFSRRAFRNDKIDLDQAEAIADLIASGSEAAMRSATRSLNGVFSQSVNALLADLVELRVFIEAAIDFPEEEIDFIADSDVDERLGALASQLDALLATAQRGRRLRDGLKLVIAGAPNAGKSSLLNQLAEQEAAIVTDVPGTTRDVLREHITIDGLPIHVVDTAGLRDTTDTVEREGIRRAQREMISADRILLLVDRSDATAPVSDVDALAAFADQLPALVPITLVHNKIDLLEGTPQPTAHPGQRLATILALSARTGAGLDLLRQHLLDTAGFAAHDGSEFSARQRHIRALQDCADHLQRGIAQLREQGAAELIADDLRYAQDSLGRITGRFTSDDLLGQIFSSFCIGK